MWEERGGPSLESGDFAGFERPVKRIAGLPIMGIPTLRVARDADDVRRSGFPVEGRISQPCTQHEDEYNIPIQIYSRNTSPNDADETVALSRQRRAGRGCWTLRPRRTCVDWSGGRKGWSDEDWGRGRGTILREGMIGNAGLARLKMTAGGCLYVWERIGDIVVGDGDEVGTVDEEKGKDEENTLEKGVEEGGEEGSDSVGRVAAISVLTVLLQLDRGRANAVGKVYHSLQVRQRRNMESK
ncbi:hypothetical protein SISSUDRAFT_1032946 [Sistotremastrum suecicum HHB10207 ss-3]|uniref:Uncharacterized protein n=1 Tax=Sistotremastrum suecicum HHB10207 ss-3 TaxID=1314776 RepID=A0A166DX44_9AGAM|nr:hypothetical protein SISSUDRAFT_1032946 [Sistotremastrum suecicum HHB10207 ss-3]